MEKLIEFIDEKVKFMSVPYLIGSVELKNSIE